MAEIVPAGGGSVVVCHWNNGGGWDALDVATSALNGHEQHDRDIWPPVGGVSEGQNWPDGEDIWLNDCRLQATPEPSQSATSSGTAPPSNSASVSATPTLPDTGPGEVAAMTAVGVALTLAGIWLKVQARRHNS
jgi:LPXTG-motif cell wall-anchored protein